MAKLATVEALRIRLSLGDIPDVNTRASAALESATIRLSSIIRTRFERQTVSDLFWIDPVQEPWRGDFLELYLTHGFLFEDEAALPDPIITTARLSEFKNSLSAADLIDDSILIKQLRKGLVMITDEEDGSISTPQFRHSNKFYVQVDYTCGFETSTDKYGKNYKLVPDWLEEAALMQAAIIFKSDCSEESATKGGGDVNIKQNDIMILIERYIRYYPSARKTIQ